MGYFHKDEAWSNTGESLTALLKDLCKSKDLDDEDLTSRVVEQIGRSRFEEYLEKERGLTNPELLAALRSEYQDLRDEYTVTRLPRD